MFTFNLSEVATGAPLPDDFLTRLEHVDLEHILKYALLPLYWKKGIDDFRFVYLPRLTVYQELTGDGFHTAKANDTVLSTTSKSISVAQIFEWLRAREVMKIIKVIVIEDDKAPHGDDVIEATLEGFQVEVFDWRKLDVCSQTIRAAAKHVREVFLYTRGQRAVLWGWSAVDGLISLPQVSMAPLE